MHTYAHAYIHICQGLTTTAAKRSLVALIPRSAKALLQSLPALEFAVMHETKRRLLETFRRESLPFFADLSDDGLRNAAQKSTLQLNLSPNDVITEQGEPGRAFHVVLAGSVTAVRTPSADAPSAASRHSSSRGPFRARSASFIGTPSPREGRGSVQVHDDPNSWTLVPGQYFGEMPLIFSGTVASATYKTDVGGTILLTLPREGFHALFANDPSLLAEVHIKLLREKATLQDVLNHRRARVLFAQFLERQKYGTSNALGFYTAITRYKTVGEIESLPHAFLAISQSIVGEFVLRHSPNAVNLTHEARTEILEAHMSGPVSPRLFESSAVHIFKKLQDEQLPAFYDSSLFRGLLDTLGSYSPELLSTDDADESEVRSDLQQLTLHRRGRTNSATSTSSSASASQSASQQGAPAKQGAAALKLPLQQMAESAGAAASRSANPFQLPPELQGNAIGKKVAGASLNNHLSA